MSQIGMGSKQNSCWNKLAIPVSFLLIKEESIISHKFKEKMQYLISLQSRGTLDSSSIWIQRRTIQLIKGLDNKSYEKWLREVEFLSLENLSQGRPLQLKGCCSDMAVSLFCPVSSENITGNGLKLYQGRFRLGY